MSLLHFGNAGFGGDDTNVFQTALNSTAANGQTLEIPAGNYNINPISFPNNSNVFVDAGATVTANSGYGANSVMLTVYALECDHHRGWRGSYCGLSDASRSRRLTTSGRQPVWHCLDVETATQRDHQPGFPATYPGGDGLYLRTSTNVTVDELYFRQ